MKGEGEIQSESCTDGKPQRIARYQEDGLGPEFTDKGVVRSEEGSGLMKGFYGGSTMWREWRMIELPRESMQAAEEIK